MTLLQRLSRLTSVAIGSGTLESALSLSRPVFCRSHLPNGHEDESHGRESVQKGKVRHAFEEQGAPGGGSYIQGALEQAEPAYDQKAELTVRVHTAVQSTKRAWGLNEGVNRKLWASVPLMLQSDTSSRWFTASGLRRNTTNPSVSLLLFVELSCRTCKQMDVPYPVLKVSLVTMDARTWEC